MKHYEEMAQRVFERAEEYRQRKMRNRRIYRCAAGLVCLCFVASLGIGREEEPPTMQTLPALIDPVAQSGVAATMPPKATQTNQTQTEQPATGVTQPQPTEENKVPAPGFVLLAATTQKDLIGTSFQKNLTLPLHYRIRVRDLSGLSDEDRQIAIAEERKWHQDQMDAGLDGSGLRLGNCTNRENYVISMIRTGCFRLKVEDYSKVKSIEITSATEYGKVDVCLSDQTYPNGQFVSLTPEQIPEQDRQNGLAINWKYSSLVLDLLDKDPQTPLSAFSDTIVFTVAYVDGTAQQCRIQIAVQENGEILATQLGNIITV